MGYILSNFWGLVCRRYCIVGLSFFVVVDDDDVDDDECEWWNSFVNFDDFEFRDKLFSNLDIL